MTETCLLTRLKGERIRVNIQRIGQRAGIHRPDSSKSEEHLTPHTFRHFFTTALRLNGCPTDLVAELRGDKRTLSQDAYYKIPIDHLIVAYEKYIPAVSVPTYKTLTLAEFETEDSQKIKNRWAVTRQKIEMKK